MTDKRVWLVRGASRGLGCALVTGVAAAGDTVIATARDAKSVATHHPSIVPMALDVRHPQQAREVAPAVVDRFGRIDVLVNNAGYGFVGAFEEMTDDEFRGQIDTNFWGVIHVTRAVVPIMRKQGAGRILQVTSVGGRNAGAGLSGYHAAKFAVEGFSESLALEVLPLGIQVCMVEPGGFRTDWGGAFMSYAKEIGAYRESVGKRRTFMQGDYKFPGDPDKAAAAIRALVAMPKMPLRQPLGTDASIILKFTYEQALAELEKTAPLARTTDADDADPSMTTGILDRLKGWRDSYGSL